jgi:hypothetical protein
LVSPDVKRESGPFVFIKSGRIRGIWIKVLEHLVSFCLIVKTHRKTDMATIRLILPPAGPKTARPVLLDLPLKPGHLKGAINGISEIQIA